MSSNEYDPSVHYSDDCGFDLCSYCGCCAHGRQPRAGCRAEDAPRGMSCPVADCGCEGRS